MKQNYAAGSYLVNQPRSHPLRIIGAPIIGDCVPVNDLIAEPQKINARGYVLIAVRRPEQPLSMRGDGLCAPADLCPPFAAGDT